MPDRERNAVFAADILLRRMDEKIASLLMQGRRPTIIWLSPRASRFIDRAHQNNARFPSQWWNATAPNRAGVSDEMCELGNIGYRVVPRNIPTFVRLEDEIWVDSIVMPPNTTYDYGYHRGWYELFKRKVESTIHRGLRLCSVRNFDVLYVHDEDLARLRIAQGLMNPEWSAEVASNFEGMESIPFKSLEERDLSYETLFLEEDDVILTATNGAVIWQYTDGTARLSPENALLAFSNILGEIRTHVGPLQVDRLYVSSEIYNRVVSAAQGRLRDIVLSSVSYSRSSDCSHLPDTYRDYGVYAAVDGDDYGELVIPPVDGNWDRLRQLYSQRLSQAAHSSTSVETLVAPWFYYPEVRARVDQGEDPLAHYPIVFQAWGCVIDGDFSRDVCTRLRSTDTRVHSLREEDPIAVRIFEEPGFDLAYVQYCNEDGWLAYSIHGREVQTGGRFVHAQIWYHLSLISVQGVPTWHAGPPISSIGDVPNRITATSLVEKLREAQSDPRLVGQLMYRELSEQEYADLYQRLTSEGEEDDSDYIPEWLLNDYRSETAIAADALNDMMQYQTPDLGSPLSAGSSVGALGQVAAGGLGLANVLQSATGRRLGHNPNRNGDVFPGTTLHNELADFLEGRSELTRPIESNRTGISRVQETNTTASPARSRPTVGWDDAWDTDE